ncbi:MAG: SpoIID/LytB domain-containing protein [Candidatus Omnitrophota bacterium]
MFKKISIIFLFFFLVSLNLFANNENYVRVAILDAENCILTIIGKYEILDYKTGNLLYSSKKNLYDVKVLVDESGNIKIGNLDLKGSSFKIKSSKVASLYINKRKFRGLIYLIPKNKNVLVVNSLNVEDYVKGVLYNEVSHFWPLEALKAQAIVSRTFVLYQKELNANKDFDVTNDIYSQVYKGYLSERSRTNIAVNRTRGEILTYKEKNIPAFCHATCGGRTEDATNLWNIDIKPLDGVVCNFCKGSPHFFWEKSMPLKEFVEKLNEIGFKVSNIKEVSIAQRTSSGRIAKLKVIDENQSFLISAKDFRQTLHPNFIRSTNFFTEIKDGTIYFKGLGWGHGVGFCQWGAYFMSKKGYRAEQILKYYYPGINISRTN